MFFTIYKTTFKNILRSSMTWMVLAVFGFITYSVLTQASYKIYSFEYKETLLDTDPRFVFEFEQYVQSIINLLNGRLMSFAMPLFTVVTTVLVLNRDYGDQFYEIEKAAGLKPSQYLFGRLAALVTLNFIVLTTMAFLFLHIYFILRGGVPELGWFRYFTDSAVRMMRLVVFFAMPTILFYIGFTYCVGSICKSGLAGAAVSIGYIIFTMIDNIILSAGKWAWYFNYFSPMPQKVETCFHYYDTDRFQSLIVLMDTDLGKVALCIGIFVGLAVIYSAIAYLLMRKRDR